MFIITILISVFLGCNSGVNENTDDVSLPTSGTDNHSVNLYPLFSGSSVNVIWNGNPSQSESGIWCNKLDECACWIAWSRTPSSVEFQATIKGTYPPFSVLWYYDSNTYTDNFKITSISSGKHSVKLYVTDNKSNTVVARGNGCEDQEEIMMIFNSR